MYRALCRITGFKASVHSHFHRNRLTWSILDHVVLHMANVAYGCFFSDDSNPLPPKKKVADHVCVVIDTCVGTVITEIYDLPW